MQAFRVAYGIEHSLQPMPLVGVGKAYQLDDTGGSDDGKTGPFLEQEPSDAGHDNSYKSFDHYCSGSSGILPLDRRVEPPESLWKAPAEITR